MSTSTEIDRVIKGFYCNVNKQKGEKRSRQSHSYNLNHFGDYEVSFSVILQHWNGECWWHFIIKVVKNLSTSLGQYHVCWWPDNVRVQGICRYNTDPGIILGMGSTNERWHHIVMSSLIGWAHTQNDPCWLNWQNSFAHAGRLKCQNRTQIQTSLTALFWSSYLSHVMKVLRWVLIPRQVMLAAVRPAAEMGEKQVIQRNSTLSRVTLYTAGQLAHSPAT